MKLLPWSWDTFTGSSSVSGGVRLLLDGRVVGILEGGVTSIDIGDAGIP